MFDQVSSVFFDEANELLDNLEGYLLTLETEPENQEVISAVFRAMHTIKGSSGMFGFDEILCLEQGVPFCASSPKHASGAHSF